MKLTNRQIAEGLQAVQLLPPLPIRQAFIAAKLKNLLRPLVEVIEEQRIALVERLAIRDGAGQLIRDEKNEVTIAADKQSEWREGFKTLYAIENEVAWTDKIKLPEKIASTCDKCHHNMEKSLEIDSNVLAALDWVIEL